MTTKLKDAQVRLAEVRLWQARHQQKVARCLSTLRNTRITSSPRIEEARETLNQLNTESDAYLVERGQLELIISEEISIHRATEVNAKNLTSIVCALITSADSPVSPSALVSTAIRINNEIHERTRS